MVFLERKRITTLELLHHKSKGYYIINQKVRDRNASQSRECKVITKQRQKRPNIYEFKNDDGTPHTSGLRSRCTTPRECMKLTAEMSFLIIWLASLSVNLSFFLILSSSSPPCNSSKTRYVCTLGEKIELLTQIIVKSYISWDILVILHNPLKVN